MSVYQNYTVCGRIHVVVAVNSCTAVRTVGTEYEVETFKKNVI